MKMLGGLFFVCLLFPAAITAQKDQSQTHVAVITVIKNAQGKSVGSAVFSEAKSGGVKMDLTITALPPGEHAFHIHQKPVCDAAEDFDTAGLRFDPTGEFYGNTEHHAHSGPSAGDPGMMIKVTVDGTGHMTTVFPKLTMGDDDHSLFYDGGTAIVFHSAANASGPTRIACGIIRKTPDAK